VKRGRKPKPPEERLAEKFEIRFTTAQMDSLCKAAVHANVSVPALIRERLFRGQILGGKH
jgi:hypothetical protein